MQSASCSCSPEQRFCFSSDTQGCALRCVISGRSTGSCAMSPCYQAGPHNYSMSLPGWFSHHLELLSLTGGTEKDQWRGSDVTPLFEAHLCCWLGEALLSVLSAECPKHLHLRGSTKLEAFFFFFPFSLHETDLFFLWLPLCTTCRRNAPNEWLELSSRGTWGGTRGSCLPLHSWRGTSAPDGAAHAASGNDGCQWVPKDVALCSSST